jgi:hypothetical protein
MTVAKGEASVTRNTWTDKAIVVASLALLIGCGLLGQSDPRDATLTPEAYRNHYFGFEAALPEGWTVAAEQTTEAITRTGVEALAGDDPLKRAAATAAMKDTHQLLTITKYPVGSPVDFNPMFMVMAEKVSHLPGVKSGKDYLFHLKRTIAASRVPLAPTGEALVADIGGEEFFQQIFEFDHPSIKATQSYNVAIREGYALSFVLTSQGQSQAQELAWILSSVYFD